MPRRCPQASKLLLDVLNGISALGDIGEQQWDDLLAQAAREADPVARLALLSQAEHMLFGGDDPEMPMLLLCQLVQLYMYEPGEVTGLTQHPRLIQYLWQVEATN